MQITRLMINHIYYRLSKIQAHIYGATFGASRALEYFINAPTIVLGGYLVGKGEVEFHDMFKYVCLYFLARIT